MSGQVIICPQCGHRIPLTEALSHQLKEELAKEFEAGREKLIREAKESATKALALEMADLKEQMAEKERALKEAQQTELDLRKRQREIEEKAKNLDLEVARKLDKEKESIQEATAKRLLEQHRLKDLEKDKVITDLRNQIDDLKLRAEKGSEQAKGEVIELDLEAILKSRFLTDAIEPVPKGKEGADVLQRVHNQLGHYCGTILWESKRAKIWIDGWIAKLKDDQLAAKADLAVLRTMALPKDIENFDQKDGVWVSDYASTIGLATALRNGLLELALTRISATGKTEKMEAVYNYISSGEFRRRVEAIAGAFNGMKSDLEQEKQAMTRIWAKREKQIQRVIDNTVGMHGDVQGIMGKSVPKIESLELKALTEGTEPEESPPDKD